MSTSSHRFTYLVLGLILCLAAYLRLSGVADNPAWYTDEGTHIDIARHLLAGRVQYQAVDQSWLLFARQPLFELLLAGVWRGQGEGIAALRLLTGLLGVLSVAALFSLAQRLTRRPALALLAAWLLAIYPPAVIYSRFGFSYNLLTPLVWLTVLGLAEYWRGGRRRWLLLAALATGLGLITDLWMGGLVPPFFLVVLARRRGDAGWSGLLLIAPAGLYAGLMLLSAPQAFWFDAQYILLRLNGVPLSRQAAVLWDNLVTLIRENPAWAPALLGLACLKPARLRNLALLYTATPILLLGRSVALYSLSFYYTIPLLPFVALGTASLATYGLEGVWRVLGERQPLVNRGLRRGLQLAAGAALVLPWALTLPTSLAALGTGFTTAVDIFLIQPAEARAVRDYLRQHTRAEDVIIASPAVAWQLPGRVADFQLSLAAAGRPTAYLPPDIPAERFVFDPRLAQARFVVVDKLWRNWAASDIPAAAEMLAQVERWPVAFQAGETTIYRSPHD